MSALRLSIDRLSRLLPTFSETSRKEVQDVFSILCEFLHPQSTISYTTAAMRILDKYPEYCIEFPPLEAVVVELAQQIPCSHPSLRKLALLTWTIGRSRKRLEMIEWDGRSSDVSFEL